MQNVYETNGFLSISTLYVRTRVQECTYYYINKYDTHTVSSAETPPRFVCVLCVLLDDNKRKKKRKTTYLFYSS